MGLLSLCFYLHSGLRLTSILSFSISDLLLAFLAESLHMCFFVSISICLSPDSPCSFRCYQSLWEWQIKGLVTHHQNGHQLCLRSPLPPPLYKGPQFFLPQAFLPGSLCPSVLVAEGQPRYHQAACLGCVLPPPSDWGKKLCPSHQTGSSQV